MAAPTVVRVLEFFSGIGGLHYAVKASGLEEAVVAAIDINDLANNVYQYNFPNVNLMQRNIQSITVEEFSDLDADMFLMSPPCQPFTRVGLKGDSNDPRTQSFLHVLDMLPHLPRKPDYILVENVKGFETSNTRNYLIRTLRQCDYVFQEFLLSPTHFDIPNQRLRYFLVAKQCPLAFNPSRISKRELDILLRQQVHTDLGHDKDSLGIKFKDGECDNATVEPNSERHFGIAHSGKPSCSFDTTHINCKVESCEQGQDPKTPYQAVSHSCCIEAGSKERICKTVSSASTKCSGRETDSTSFSCDRSKNDSSSTIVHSNAAAHEPGEDVMDKTCIDKIVANETKGINQLTEDCVTTQDQESTEAHCQLSLEDSSEERRQDLCRTVKDYLEDLSTEETERFLLPDKLLTRFARIIDVVKLGDANTRCFTKAYGHYVEGTGSVLQMNTAAEGEVLLKSRPQDVGQITEEYLEQLRSLKIRYFTPREIANLHHFPETFGFPDELSLKQRYRVLGNSLNVHVVSVLLRYMISEFSR